MPSNALTLVVPIQLGQEGALDTLLTEIGNDIKGNPHIDFSKLSTTHFLRWVVLPEVKREDQYYAPQLAFESNFDGSLDAHMDELLAVGGPLLARVYGHCVGCPTDSATHPKVFKDYLLSYSLPCAAFFRAYPNYSVRYIHNNTRIRARIQQLVDKLQPHRKPPEQLHAAIRQELESQPELDLTPSPEPRPDLWGRITTVLMESRPAQVALGLLLLPLLVLAALMLRWKELTEPAVSKQTDRAALEVVSREDYKVQNQLTHLVEIKPGWFRLLTLRSVLWAIDFLAKNYFNRGNLGGISTIHFARWVIIDGGRRLLFFSNYDGSWERYLGDFIDQASVGLTGVWSNTRGFPKTLFLVFKGATDEETFKQWTRDHQERTQVWYSAHASESVHNILDNVELQTKILTPLTPQEAQTWLQQL